MGKVQKTKNRNHLTTNGKKEKEKPRIIGKYECLDQTVDTLSEENKKMYNEQSFCVVSCFGVTQKTKKMKVELFIPVSWVAATKDAFLYPKKSKAKLSKSIGLCLFFDVIGVPSHLRNGRKFLMQLC